MSDILIPQILNGLTIGAILVLIATGLTLIFGLMGVVNFSHGAMYMLGAYIAMQVLSTTGHYGLALLASLVGVALLGFLLEYFMIRRLYGHDPLLQVLLTFGVAIVIRESVEIVWGPRIQVFLPPTSLSGSAVLWGVQYPVYRLAVLALSIVLAGSIWLTLRFTDIGLIVRAGSSDRNMVAALGINVRRGFTSVFVMGAMLAALAGMLVAPLRSVYPDMGNDVILYAFVAVIVGGLGSYQGAIAGALLVGFAELLGVLMFPGLERAFVYVLVALVMALKPSGLFGRPREGSA